MNNITTLCVTLVVGTTMLFTTPVFAAGEQHPSQGGLDRADAIALLSNILERLRELTYVQPEILVGLENAHTVVLSGRVMTDTVQIDWGNEVTEALEVNEEGVFVARYEYPSSGRYLVAVTDRNGATETHKVSIRR